MWKYDKGGMKYVGLDYFGAACCSVFYNCTLANTEQHAALLQSRATSPHMPTLKKFLLGLIFF